MFCLCINLQETEGVEEIKKEDDRYKVGNRQGGGSRGRRGICDLQRGVFDV